jgi:cobalamin biosynthesis protein CobD/CbiB
MIRQWIDKLMEALRHAVDRSTTMDEIIFGAILAFALVIILACLGLFD